MKKILLIFMAFVGAGFVAAQNNAANYTYNFQRALEAYQEDDYDKALEYLGSEVSNHPSNGYAHTLAAMIYHENNREAAALNCCVDALKYLKKSDDVFLSEVYSTMMNIYINCKDTAEAIRCSELYLKASPRSALIASGQMYYVFEQYAQSELQLLKAVKWNSKTQSAYGMLARTQLQLRKSNEALANAEKAIELDSTYTYGYVLKGQALYQLKRYPEAIHTAIRSIKQSITSDAIELLNDIADSVDYRMVLDSLQKYEKTEADNFLWPALEGDIYDSYALDYEAALQMYLRAIKINPMDQIYKSVAFIYEFYIGDEEAARQYYDKAIEKDSTRAFNYIAKASFCQDIGSLDESLSLLDNAQRLSPFAKNVYELRARNYRMSGDYRSALDEYTKAVLCDPEAISAHSGRATMMSLTGDSVSATAEWELIMKMCEGKGMTACEYYLYHGQTDSVNALLEKEVENEEKMIRPRASEEYNIACMYCRAGNETEALKWLRRSFEHHMRDFAHVLCDWDLVSLRTNPEFQALIAEYKEIQKKELATLTVKAE
ncbi:MAG: tetratricopeptide repeat protein [Paludibacteraceae bacterium]|nr:tetratricopeptide repeat protein [Paludibacteraceae bacterium]